MLVGTIVLVDLRLLGWMRRVPVKQLAGNLAPWTRAGFVVMLTTGPLMFLSDVARYRANPAFGVKMALLATALVSHFTIRRRAVHGSPVLVRLVAVLSLVLWTCVVLAGRGIADFDI